MSYPVWWSDTITVYNKYEDTQTDVITWYRTTLTDCFWKNDFSRFKMGDVEVQSDSIICRIPENKKFLEKQDWVKIPNDRMNEYFTLAQGDIIIKGEVDDEINEYTSGKRSSDIVEKYKWQGCMLIDRLTIDTGPGRGLPHYHVIGV